MQNEVAYVISDERRLRSEVIRIEGDEASLQVFEETRGIKVGDRVEFVGELLSVALGPGLLGKSTTVYKTPSLGLPRNMAFFCPGACHCRPWILPRAGSLDLP